MPGDRIESREVIKIANDIFAKKILPDALPVIIVSKIHTSACLANFFRKEPPRR